MTTRPLASYSHEYTVLKQRIVEIAPTERTPETPAGMTRIPRDPFAFKVEGTEIEGENGSGVDVQFPWEDAPRRFHEHAIDAVPFYTDKYSNTR